MILRNDHDNIIVLIFRIANKERNKLFKKLTNRMKLKCFFLMIKNVQSNIIVGDNKN